MSEEESVTRDDIPQVEDLKAAILTELGSGRARSFEAVLKDVASSLNLSTRQRRYKIKGSKTTLLANRFEKARSELKAENLIEYPARGKMKLNATATSSKAKPSHAKASEGSESHAPKGTSNGTGKHASKPLCNEATSTASDPSRAAAKHVAEPTANTKVEKQSASKPLSKSGTTPVSATAPQKPKHTTVAANATSAKHETQAPHAGAASTGTWAKYRKYVPVALVVLGIILCFAQLGLPGAVFGGAGLFLKTKDSRNSNVGDPAAPKATLWVGVASILIGLVLAFTSCSGASQDKPSDQGNASTSSSASTQEGSKSSMGVLSFKVTAADWPDKNIPVQVSVEGKTNAGETVSDHYEALIGTAYALEYGAGSYTIAVTQGSLVCNDVPFAASPSTCAFDGTQDRLVTLSLAKDEKALLATQEAKRKAEEAAQAEAERKAADQAEADRKAAEEAAAASAAAAAIAQSENAAVDEGDSSGGGEYIGNVNSHKFHLPSCGTLPKEKNRRYFSSRDEAVNSGYVPCKNCNP